MTGESVYIKEHKQIIEGVIWRGTATDVVGNTFLKDTNIPAAYGAGVWNDERLFIFTGTGAGQTRKIKNYDGAGEFEVYDAWNTNPDTTSRYQVISGEGTVGAAAAGDATAANQTTIIGKVDTIDGLHDIPVADVVDNAQMRDVIGNKTDAAVTTVGNVSSLMAYLKAVLNQTPSINEIVLYPVAIIAGTAKITDDGSSPAFYADNENSGGGIIAEGTPFVHWEQRIDHFEREGTINVTSVFLELRWQHKTAGGNAGSKIQITGNGGTNWYDVTDSIAEVNAAYQDKTRIGVSLRISAITAGANKLGFRLVSWVDAANVSSAKMRSDSYIRISYRKS